MFSTEQFPWIASSQSLFCTCLARKPESVDLLDKSFKTHTNTHFANFSTKAFLSDAKVFDWMKACNNKKYGEYRSISWVWWIKAEMHMDCECSKWKIGQFNSIALKHPLPHSPLPVYSSQNAYTFNVCLSEPMKCVIFKTKTRQCADLIQLDLSPSIRLPFNFLCLVHIKFHLSTVCLHWRTRQKPWIFFSYATICGSIFLCLTILLRTVTNNR